jgi:hypothetical protein
MDWTSIAIAALGLIGTLVGALTAPVITERLRRAGAQREQLLARRLDVYAEVMTAASRLVNAAVGVAGSAESEEVDLDTVERLVGEVRVVASDQVYHAFVVLIELSGKVARRGIKLYDEDVEEHEEGLILVPDPLGDGNTIPITSHPASEELAALLFMLHESFLHIETAVRSETGS